MGQAGQMPYYNGAFCFSLGYLIAQSSQEAFSLQLGGWAWLPLKRKRKEKRKEKRERRENKRREKKGREEGRKALAPHSDVPKAKGLKTPPAWRSFISKFRFRKKVLKH